MEISSKLGSQKASELPLDLTLIINTVGKEYGITSDGFFELEDLPK